MEKSIMKHRIVSVVLVALACIVAGCKDDPASNTTTTPNGSVSAKVNGSAWAASSVQATWQSNVLSIGGSQLNGSNNHQINIAGLVSQTGTYQLNPFAGLNANYTEAGVSQGGLSSKIFSVTSGTLVVNTLTATGASGTFSFEAKDAQGGTETRSITEGKFDVKF
jgi:hypothetical protein